MLESKERKAIKALKVNDSITFPMVDYIKITRMLANMNLVARSKGEVESGELMFSVSQKVSKDGSFEVIKRK